MERYLSRMPQAGWLDALGARAAILLGCEGWFFLWWGVSLPSMAAGLALTALIVCGIVYLMTKNGFVSLLLAAVLEAGLIGAYLWDSSRFEGLFPQIISQLSLFARFYTIVNGVFDVTAIVYYLSVTGFFLFLSVQSLEKRRWSE